MFGPWNMFIMFGWFLQVVIDSLVRLKGPPALACGSQSRRSRCEACSSEAASAPFTNARFAAATVS